MANQDELTPVIKVIENTRKQAGLEDQPFVLGVVSSKQNGRIISLLRDRLSDLERLGATSFEWREKAKRGKLSIGGEELHVSVDHA